MQRGKRQAVLPIWQQWTHKVFWLLRKSQKQRLDGMGPGGSQTGAASGEEKPPEQLAPRGCITPHMCLHSTEVLKAGENESVPVFFFSTVPSKTCIRECTRTHMHTLQATAFTGSFTLQVGLLVSNKQACHLFLDVITLMKGLLNASPQLLCTR